MSADYQKVTTQLASERGLAVNDLFAQFEQSNKELAARSDAAQIEQIGFRLAMADKDYLQELNNVATMNNLQDDLAFKAESQRLILGEEMQSLLKQLNWEEAFNQDTAAFEQQLASIDLESAVAIANAQVAAANTQAAAEGVTDATKSYYDYRKTKADEDAAAQRAK